MKILDKLLTFINFHIYNFRNELLNPKNQDNNIVYRDFLFSYEQNRYLYHVLEITPDLKMICLREKLCKK